VVVAVELVKLVMQAQVYQEDLAVAVEVYVLKQVEQQLNLLNQEILAHMDLETMVVHPTDQAH
jgi:hypothetical protein